MKDLDNIKQNTIEGLQEIRVQDRAHYEALLENKDAIIQKLQRELDTLKKLDTKELEEQVRGLQMIIKAIVKQRGLEAEEASKTA